MATTILGPISTQQIGNVFYVGGDGFPTIQSAIDYAQQYNGGIGQVIITQGYPGSESILGLANGGNGIFISDRRNGSAQDYVWMAEWAVYTPAYFVQLGPIMAQGTPDTVANQPPLSIGLFYDPNGEDDNGTAGMSVMAATGGTTPFFSLNLVSDTNGNIPVWQVGADAEGLNLITNLRSSVHIYEDLTVDGDSTLSGDLWLTGDLTADTADITGALTAGSAAIGGPLSATSAAFDVCVVDGSNVRTYANTPAAALPPVGVGVSTGLAWGPSIDPATIAYINKPNTFSAAQFLDSTLNVAGTVSIAETLYVGTGGCFIGGGSDASMTINSVSPGGLLLNWWSGGLLQFGNGNASAVGSVNSLGDASFNGTLTAGTFMTITPTAGSYAVAPDYPVLRADTAGNLLISAGASRMYLNWDSGTNGVIFGNGTSTQVGAIDGLGNAEFNGTFTAGGAKNFRIRHPLNAKKWLTHSCIEGPEVAVFYRGEVRCAKFTADVKLPDYFEALCEKKGRTVQLTQIDNGKDLAMLSATRIEDGKFRIRATVADALVCWEVKAVRAGVAVEVVSERREAEHDFGTDGAGTHKDGKLRAKAPNKSTGTTAKPRRAR